MQATVRYVHKISPSDKDIAGPFKVSEKVLASCSKLRNLKPLRDWFKVNKLHPVGRLAEFRVRGNTISLFPCNKTKGEIWHCINVEFTSKEEEPKADC